MADRALQQQKATEKKKFDVNPTALRHLGLLPPRPRGTYRFFDSSACVQGVQPMGIRDQGRSHKQGLSLITNRRQGMGKGGRGVLSALLRKTVLTRQAFKGQTKKGVHLLLLNPAPLSSLIHVTESTEGSMKNHNLSADAFPTCY